MRFLIGFVLGVTLGAVAVTLATGQAGALLRAQFAQQRAEWTLFDES